MRYFPKRKYSGKPCSYVGVGCAYEKTVYQTFDEDLPEGLREDGYLSLYDANKFIRKYLDVKKKVYYKRKERIPLWKFLKENKEKCCICVLGHFVYADENNYWSFFDNDEDEVVCVWYIM